MNKPNEITSDDLLTSMKNTANSDSYFKNQNPDKILEDIAKMMDRLKNDPEVILTNPDTAKFLSNNIGQEYSNSVRFIGVSHLDKDKCYVVVNPDLKRAILEGVSDQLLNDLFKSRIKFEKHECNKCNQTRDLKDVKYVVVHISGSGLNLDKLINYFKHGPHSVQVSYLVEGNRVVQITRDGIVPWAIGDHMKPKITNKDIISVMIVSDSNGRTDAESLSTAEVLIKGLIDLYSLTTDQVLRYSTRGVPCVGDLSSADRWNAFIEEINKLPSIEEYDPLDLIHRMI